MDLVALVAAVIAVVAPPQEMGCGPYSSVPERAPHASDVSAGPVTLVGFASLFATAPERTVYRPGRAFVLKMPVVVSGSRDVTLSVPQAARRRLAIALASGDQEVSEGVSAVRYEACPRKGRATGYPDALLYAGPWRRCVTLTATAGGRTWKLRLPLGRRC